MNNEQLDREVNRLQNEIYELKRELINVKHKQGLASKKTAYEVEVPKDIEDYVFIDESGGIDGMFICDKKWAKKIYERGHAFKTDEEAEKYDKKRVLITKMEDWAKKYNEGWTPDWKLSNIDRYKIKYDPDNHDLFISNDCIFYEFLTLPYFKSRELASQFIDEFGDEIKEVFC